MYSNILPGDLLIERFTIIVTTEQLAAAFKAHLDTYGKLDICINNAGIMEKSRFWDDASETGSGAWRKVVDINLTATIDGTRLAVSFIKGKSFQKNDRDSCHQVCLFHRVLQST
jgi:NAD(P)-dependent dehydrogenase (short-subunit alcohol dehydrogenase family)